MIRIQIAPGIFRILEPVVSNAVQQAAQLRARDLSGFDFHSPAELFPSRNKQGRSQVRYRRFNTAAEAIQFAVELMSPAAMLGAYLEVNEKRFGLPEIQALYAHPAYPFKRTQKQAEALKAG
jgi:hypothetical protein